MPGLLNGFLPAKPPRPLALLHNCSKLLQAAIQGMLLVVLHLICKGLVGPILHAEAAIGHGTHLALPLLVQHIAKHASCDHYTDHLTTVYYRNLYTVILLP